MTSNALLQRIQGITILILFFFCYWVESEDNLRDKILHLGPWGVPCIVLAVAKIVAGGDPSYLIFVIW